ncbi:MAG: flagellar basal body rod protein FlgB [Deltaproteobacteria bacterium]|nr:flagellar basal body rod protein FlgB [Deltaproteobacteria bacterium]
MKMLENMLDYRTKRHKIIASNITNIDTPGFQPSDISFKDQYAKAGKLSLKTTDSMHIPKKNTSRHPLDYEISQSDEKVVIDKEMADLAENHLMYNTTVEMLARKFRGLKTVLKEAK